MDFFYEGMVVGFALAIFIVIFIFLLFIASYSKRDEDDWV
jgi:cell division protein FtsX